jgi:hypothetical protein
VKDLFNDILKLKCFESENIRIMEIYQSRIYSIFQENDALDKILKYQNIFLRIEEQSNFELNISSDDRLIEFCHYVRENNTIRFFDQPFIFILRKVFYF